MWYEMAAGKGNAKAQFNIGELYASGKGVPQDYVLAYMWFTLAGPSLSCVRDGGSEQRGYENK